MEMIAPDVHRIALVDAGLPRSAETILEALGGRTVAEHVATHAHVDHVGGSSKLIARLGLDGLAIGTGDADAVRRGHAAVKPGAVGRVVARLGGRFTPAQVTRELREGDEVGPGFEVLDAPGHSPGQIVVWRAVDRLLIAGDVLNNAVGLHEPPGMLSVDPERNRESARRLAEPRPATIAFGHGRVLRDGAKLQAYTEAL